MAGALLPGELLSRGTGTGLASPGNLCSQGLPPTTSLLLHKNQQQQKKPFLALVLSHLALIKGRMFLCGHSGVTEALGKQNPLSLSHSKDCPVFNGGAMNPPQGLGTSPSDCTRLTLCLGVLAAGVKVFWLPHGSWGCWLPVPFWYMSVTPLPACVPELLSPVESLLPVPGPLFHPAAQGLARAKHCTLKSLAVVCVLLPVPWSLVGWGTGWLRADWAATHGSVAESAGRVSLLQEMWELRVRAFPFDPCPLQPVQAGRGYLHLPHSHCIPKLGGSTPRQQHLLFPVSFPWLRLPLPCIHKAGIPEP